MPPALARRARGAEDRKIIRLGRARGPDQLLRRAHGSAPRPARAPARRARAPAGRSECIEDGIAEHAIARQALAASPPRRADPPAWWPRSPDTPARRSLHASTRVSPARRRRCCTAVRMPRRILTSFCIRLGALQQPPDAFHQMGAALGAIAKIDLLQHCRPDAAYRRSSSSGLASGAARVS